VAEGEYVSSFMVGDKVGIPGTIIEKLGEAGVFETNPYGMLTLTSFYKLRTDVQTLKDAGWVYRTDAIKKVGPPVFEKLEGRLHCLLLYGKLPFYFLPELLTKQKVPTKNVVIPNVSCVELGSGFPTKAIVISKNEAKELLASGKAMIIKDAAEILGEELATVWRWAAETDAFDVYRISGYRSRSRLLGTESVMKQHKALLPKGERISLTDAGIRVHTSRQTIKAWGNAGKLDVSILPGGQPYLSESQIQIAENLSEEVEKHRYSKGRPQASQK